MQYIPKLPETNVNVTPTSPLRDLLVMLGGVMVLLVVAYAGLGLLVDFLVPRISPDMEKSMSGFFASERAGRRLDDDGGRALQTLADRLTARCVELPYAAEVEVVDNDMVNALALPGGRIVVFSGLVDAAGSENELAFVLAHEMGHFVNRDHLSSLGRGLVLVTLSSMVFGADSVIGQRAGEMLMLSELGFSRSHEAKADSYALDALNCLYGHVGGATGFFEHTADMESDLFAGHYLSTHPLHDQRISSLKGQADRAGYIGDGVMAPADPYRSGRSVAGNGEEVKDSR